LTHRVIFIDLARALAVVMMVYGHTVSALLAREYRAGPWFDAWMFQRGLTSSLFLLLSGFAFAIATTRHWPAHARVTPAVWRRIRRFGLFILLGYALHFPGAHIWELPYLTDDRWRSFFAVDVLQLIGVTFIVIQLVVLVVQSRRAFMAVALALAALVVWVTPAVWSAEWWRGMPLVVASYFTQALGSQFPLIPWAAFVLVGAGVGQIYARWGAGHLAAFAHGFIAAGVVLGAFALVALGGIPSVVVLRTGICLALLGVIAHASRFINRLPHVFGAVAQESLVIYFVHLLIVYGSAWNRGLVQIYGETLQPLATLGVVLAMLAAMVLLAWQWNRLKHAHPRAARWVSTAVGAWLMVNLLF